MPDSTKLLTQIAAGVITLVVIALSYWSYDLYELHMQEDHFVEWLTVALFAIGGGVRLRRAVRERRLFDGLVALFSLFVAGEEFSWGQRLIGYTPPAWFLAHNVQQETTLHNFAGAFGRPKWSLIAVLIGYGLLLPLGRRFAPSRKLMERVGATAPSDFLAAWFALMVVILVWYPLTYSGEWVELVASVLFLGAVTTNAAFAASLVAGMLAALALTIVSARRGAGPTATACARAEVASLLGDITNGAGNVDLLGAASVEKRVWTAVADDEIDARLLPAFGATSCAESIPSSRRRYGVDPWGSSYWVRVDEGADGSANVQVYSLGPNRRRDQTAAAKGDDIVSRISIDPFATESGAPTKGADSSSR